MEGGGCSGCKVVSGAMQYITIVTIVLVLYCTETACIDNQSRVPPMMTDDGRSEIG